MNPKFLSASAVDQERMPRRILVCLDRSGVSEACLPYAVLLAKAFGSKVTLVHVLEARARAHHLEATDALAWEISTQEAQGYLNRIQKKLAHELDAEVTARLEEGSPDQRIVDLAKEVDADVTVLGSHGEGRAADKSLGNTAQRVLAATQRSVLIVPIDIANLANSSVNTSAGRAAAARGQRSVLVPLDGTTSAERVLPLASRLALALGAKLTLVHVVEEPLASNVLHAEDLELAKALTGRLQASAKRYLGALILRGAKLGWPETHALVSSHRNTRKCLLEISGSDDAELVVISAHGSTCDSYRSFGSVAAYLLTHSNLPVLVLQDLPARSIPEEDVTAPPSSLRANYSLDLA